MIFIAIVFILLLGLSIIFRLSLKLSSFEILGFSFLIGIGMITIIMFILDIIGITFSGLILFLITVVIILILNFPFKTHLQFFINAFTVKQIQFSKTNLVRIFFLIAVIFLVYASVSKSLYWPTFAYDNVAGYDLMAKVMAKEGRINNSLFEINHEPISGSARRLIYPPLVAGSFSIAYLCDLDSSKIITSLFLISFIIALYGILQKFGNKTAAAVCTFFTFITPEFFAFTSLSTTNIPTAIYASLSMLSLAIWFKERDEGYFYLASIMTALTIWARSDAIVFLGAGFMILFYDGYKNKSWRHLIIFTVLSLLSFTAWSTYLKVNINIDQNVFFLYPFWDGDKFVQLSEWVYKILFNMNNYGITFYCLLVVVVINIKNLKSDKNTILLLLLVISWIMYTFLFYQMDNTKTDSLDKMMTASYRRGLFSFIPIVWAYVAFNERILELFNRLEKDLNVSIRSVSKKS